MALYLFLLAAGAGVVYAVWSFRKKLAAREAASKARFEQMLDPRRLLAASSSEVPPAAPSAAAPAAAAAAKAQPATVVPGVRERFLGPPATLAYYLLKTGLPDCEIFANVSLSAVVGASGGDREREQLLRRLSQYQLDFVVCDKNMRIVAAVDVETPGGADAAGARQFKADCLKQAGVRLVRINPAALPRRDQIRGLFSGG